MAHVAVPYDADGHRPEFTPPMGFPQPFSPLNGGMPEVDAVKQTQEHAHRVLSDCVSVALWARKHIHVVGVAPREVDVLQPRTAAGDPPKVRQLLKGRGIHGEAASEDQAFHLRVSLFRLGDEGFGGQLGAVMACHALRLQAVLQGVVDGVKEPNVHRFGHRMEAINEPMLK